MTRFLEIVFNQNAASSGVFVSGPNSLRKPCLSPNGDKVVKGMYNRASYCFDNRARLNEPVIPASSICIIQIRP